MRRSIFILCALSLVSCGKISSEAKKYVGCYYNMQISDTVPVYELRDDGTCTVRNIHPEVLTMEVTGTWTVRDDSLFIHCDPSTLRVAGDTSLVGDVSPLIERAVVERDDNGVLLSKDGIEYRYKVKRKKT